jgi:hypothetical protein
VVVKAGNGFSTYLKTDSADSCYEVIWGSSDITVNRLVEAKEISHMELWNCQGGDEPPVKEVHSLTLIFDCLDSVKETRRWEASSNDPNDEGYPLDIGYDSDGGEEDLGSLVYGNTIKFETVKNQGDQLSLLWLNDKEWVSGSDSVVATDELCEVVEGEEEEEEEEERGEVLGESDEVLGTSTVVLAATGPTDNTFALVVEILLILSVASISFIYGKAYLRE